MSNEITWTVRTPKIPGEFGPGEPDKDLRLCDLKWLVTEAERMGVGDYELVEYVEPVVGGDPQGWGLTITKTIE